MEKRVALISNVIFETYWNKCIGAAFASGSYDIQTVFVRYEEIKEFGIALGAVDVIAVCLNFEALYPDVYNDVLSGMVEYEDILHDCFNRCKELYAFVKSCGGVRLIWLGFEDCFCHNNIYQGMISVCNGLVDKVNFMLMDMLEDDTYIDLKSMIADVGIQNSYDNKSRYRWNSPYSVELINKITQELYKQYLIQNGITKKCIILDCDNVLWGGILSEDGIEGIQIGNSGWGRPYQDFQRFLIGMYYHGVILTVCSKNDKKDVLQVFGRHSGMLLKEEHISYFCCNWNNKPDNIREIADALNIGLDSMVFIDDSLFEVEAVKLMLPEVTAILYNKHNVYQNFECFNLRSDINVQTIKDRTETYKTNVRREKLKKETVSFEEYISALDMKIDIHRALGHEFARISELTQRTNKCTNGKRYTLEQIKEKLLINEYELYTVCLKDRFADFGIVGVIGISGDNMDLFSLSCRALGRKVEETMLEYAMKHGVSSVYFCSTSKNNHLPEFFRQYTLKVEEAQQS